MPLYEPVIPIRYAAVLLDTVRDIAPACITPLLRAGGLSSRSFAETSGSLSISQFDRLVCTASELVGRSDLGFEYGLRLGIEHHDLLSLALTRCRTADELLGMMARYWRMTTTCFHIQYRREGGVGEVTFRPVAPMSSLTLHVMEEMFAVSFQRDIMAMTGNQSGLRIYLSIAKPAHSERYRAARPTQFSFASEKLPQVRCVLAPALLQTSLVHRAELNGVTSGGVTLNDSAPARTRQYADFVQMILDEAEGTQPDLHALAHWLNVSPRSLLRYLAAEGKTLRAMGAETRFRRACYLLSQTTQPIGQIAQRLGYGSTIAFSYAFRQRAGMGPRDYRDGSREQ